MAIPSEFNVDRAAFHTMLLETVLTVNAEGVPSNADKDNRASVNIARGIAELLKSETISERLPGQTSGNHFEDAVAAFIRQTFCKLNHLRPGKWDIQHVTGNSRLKIAEYEQYAHLVDLNNAAMENPALAAILGNAYMIKPDVIVIRDTESDEIINAKGVLVDDKVSRLASLRKTNGGGPLLHANISCKWTIRSDRAQNARSEALTLMRNRKGRLPHVVVVTAEPTPSRLASLALGTGDIDCVYHFALYELQKTIQGLDGMDDTAEMLAIMVNGKRLKDISDLPLDLVI